jgi:hypothetical protein
VSWALPLVLLLAAGDAAPAGLLHALSAAPPGAARAVAATRALLGVPYLRDPLGEGGGPDPDPRFRLDAFDCVTFVETAVALGSSRTLGEAARALDDVRYEGAPLLAARHHEVLSQWLPANALRGYVAEATPAIAGERARREERVYTAEGWAALHRAGRAIVGLPRAREPLGRFGAWVVAPEDLPGVEGRIPDGALVFVVRADDPLRSTRITHAGLVVSAPDGARRVRHATSSTRHRKVIEESLASFLAREQAAFPGWKVVGLTFYAILDASARVQALGEVGAPAP